MDTSTSLSAVIKSLDSWPIVTLIVIVVILLLFRPPLTNLLNRIKKAKIKISKDGIEATINTVLEQLKDVPQKPPTKEVKEMLNKSPIQAIDISWQDLKKAAVTSIPISESADLSALQIASLLIEKNILDKEKAEAFYKLFEIRDEAIKPENKCLIDISTASTYSTSTTTLADLIKQKRP